MRFPAARSRAFSLIEILAVVVIILVLMALLVPATSSLVRAMNMSRAASLLTDEMNYARQTALTRNRDVEVRFYKMDSKIADGEKRYLAFRSFLVNGTNAAQPLGRVKHLPENVVLAEDAKYSTLLDPGRSGLTQGHETIPGLSSPAEYVSFLFRANGGTSLRPVNPPEGNWFLTIHLENAPTNPVTGIPDNYFTAQIDPVNGRLRSYRP